ncbi:type III-A CRISPR-associated RAMP protein Csm4 [Candidatus Poribacteria bacterium]|nr:type III-A CRISPR-associated RAMP protein Csm4 [Candidatus Poribacteria bacterium]MXY26657.1 type III-A CRISPR-associated RAMP protein Csm4 [Candidatus Poribacteria bacterium]MYK17431.1 type III-A CRISPR-associated RAMP protein Csm4 [Candidatus Poribacteria bacterium]
MPTYTIYRLTFKTQLHLGRTTGPAQEGSLGLEKTETYIPADTLFSAICQTWATFYGTESLTRFLDAYTRDGSGLPFMLTSAFPFAQDLYLFPRPLNFPKPSENVPKDAKRVQFVSQSVFQEIISGNPPQFDEGNLMNSEKVWVSPKEKEQLEASRGNDFTIWSTNTRPRVTLGSQNAGSEIWHVQTVQFNTNCGLWFAVEFDSHETKEKIETLLRVLGDTGIGGERNAGYGLFDFAETTLEMPGTEGRNQFVTLSPICPKSPEQLARLRIGNIAYTLNPLKGWGSTTGTASQRKQISMFTEGSVLHTGDTQIGRLVDVKPDNWVHPVYRYGYAWQVGIKEVVQ